MNAGQAPSTLSSLTVTWARRQTADGLADPDHRELLIDGRAVRSLIRDDRISPLGWGPAAPQIQAIDRLLLQGPADLPNGRVSLYVCPCCGDIGCGAVGMTIERGSGVFTWRDFGLDDWIQGEVFRDGYENVGPFWFEEGAYRAFLGQLRREVSEAPAREPVAHQSWSGWLKRLLNR